MAKKRRTSGSVRRMSSGRWQARVTDTDGGRVPLGTFATKADAQHALNTALVDQSRGGWVDPNAGRIKLRAYAVDWIRTRPQPLRPTTRDLYEYLLRVHILPGLGETELGKLTAIRVRKWHADMLDAGRGEPVTARSYRLLRAILNTAVEDELIAKNPCAIRGAGVDRTPERPVATLDQVFRLADAVDPRFRALILLAVFSSLREGELFALRRKYLDLDNATVRVEEQLHTLASGAVIVGPPKSDAGYRVVSIPEMLIPELVVHVERYVGAEPESLVFTGGRGAPIRRSYWGRVWRAAADSVGMHGFHFHDLRHTGNTLAAATGASTKELMARMGHASPRAALIYQHATRERDQAIATAFDALLRDRSGNGRGL